MSTVERTAGAPAAPREKTVQYMRSVLAITGNSNAQLFVLDSGDGSCGHFDLLAVLPGELYCIAYSHSGTGNIQRVIDNGELTWEWLDGHRGRWTPTGAGARLRAAVGK